MAIRGTSHPVCRHFSLASLSRDLHCPLHPVCPKWGPDAVSSLQEIGAQAPGPEAKNPVSLSSFLSISSLCQAPLVCTTHDSLFQGEAVRQTPAVTCGLVELPCAQPLSNFLFFPSFSCAEMKAPSNSSLCLSGVACDANQASKGSLS